MNNLLMLHHKLVSGMVDHLPAGYIECDYIENPSLAYIDTQIRPNSNTSIEFKFEATTFTAWSPFFGVRGPNNNPGYFVSYSNTENGYLHFGSGNAYTVDKNITGLHTLRHYKGETCIDGQTFRKSSSPYSSNNTLYLFAHNNNGKFENGNLNLRCYRCKIWDTGNLEGKDNILRDYIPCLQISSRLYGLYDMIGHRFYSSPNGVKFIGKIKNEADNYVFCKYIENRSNAYIDTGIKGSSHLIIDCIFEGLSKSTSYQTIFGVRSYGFNDAVVLTSMPNTNVLQTIFGNYMKTGGSEGTYHNVTDIEVLGRHTVTALRDDFRIDFSHWHHTSPDDFSGMNNLTIFACNEDGSIVSPANIRIYKFTIQDYPSGDLLRDFIPCQQISSGLYGLYDKVENKFYSSPNGTSFIGG